jgi:alpha-beta hydrolase superfamily lysophospholipase
MEHKKYYWQAKKGIHLFAQLWKPDKPPIAVIHFIHGLGEHSGRYTQWAHKFTEQGFSFLAMDLRGHGKSDGKRGYVKNCNDFLDDIDLMLYKSSKLFPDTPAILYGHSMGGNLVLNYVIRRKSVVNAVIITSPWLRLATQPPQYQILLGKLMCKFYPSFTQNTGLIADYLSRNKKVVADYINDPLVHSKLSASLFFDLEFNGRYILRNKHKINIPCLIMHGTDDKITSYAASKQFSNSTCINIFFKSWKHAYHELHNEEIQSELFTYIQQWIESKI